MNLFQRFLVAGTLAGVPLFSSIANAAISYGYVSDQSTYTAAAGGTVTVNVFLKEQTGGTASLVASDGGLFSAGFSATLSGTAPPNPAALTAISGNTAIFTAVGGFANLKSGGSATSRGVSIGDNGIDAGDGSITLDSNGLIKIGTLTITAGGPGSDTFFTLSRESTANITDTFTNAFNLDVNRTTSPAFTGTGSSGLNETFDVQVPSAVPEPASLSLIAIVSAAGLLVRRRRQA